MNALHFTRYWLPPVLVAAVIFWLSSKPADDLQGTGLGRILGPYTGEIAHFIEYGVLGGLTYRALLAWRRVNPDPQPTRQRLLTLGAVAVAASFLYGVTDEIHQSFVPGRSPEVRDVVIDTAGAIGGVLAYTVFLVAWSRLKRRSEDERPAEAVAPGEERPAELASGS